MPKRLSDEEFTQLLGREREPFKMAIKGHSALEAEIEAAIDTLVAGPIPVELRNARYELRLAVAAAIGVVLPEYLPLLRALSRLRNDFAHGKIDDLSPERGEAIAATVMPALGVPADQAARIEARLAKLAPITSLSVALVAARLAIRETTAALVARREDEKRIITAHRTGNALLAELMAKAEEEQPE